MIKMLGAGGRARGQVVVISAAVAPGFRSKRAKERKTCRAVYSGTCASGQVLPKVLIHRVHHASEGICLLIRL